MPAPSAVLPRVTLRLTLGTVVVGLLVTVVGAVVAVALAVRARTRDATARFLMTEVVRGVERETLQRLRAAEIELAEVAAEGAADRLPLGDLDALRARFEPRMRGETRFEWLGFAAPDGTGLYVQRAADGALLCLTGRADGTLLAERVEPDGRRAAVPPPAPRFADLHAPTWYERGLAAERPAWTPLHRRALDGAPGRACALAVRRESRPLGVLGVGFSTAFGSSVLAGMWGERAGLAAMYAPDARRIGASSSPERARAAQAVILEAVAGLPGGVESLAAGRPALTTASHEGQAVVIGLQRLPESLSMPAVAVVLVPEDDLVGHFGALGAVGLAASGALLLAGVALALWVAHRVTLPLRRVAADLERVGSFDLAEAEPLRSGIREVATLGEATARMKRSLRSFGRYVPTEVVRDVVRLGGEARLGGGVRTLTLMFTDIQGFTTLAEGQPPDRLVASLGEYLAVATEAIAGSHGTVDKFVGDGVVAFFNAPRDDAEHAAHAAEAALRLQEGLARARAGWAAAGKPAFPTRVGLHTADVVVGNIGTPERFAYTVIGDGANYAARLEALNKAYGTWILASRASRDAAGPGFVWRRVDRTSVPGRADDDDVFELLGRAGEVAPALLAARDRYEAAFAAYLERRFDAAASGFDAAAALRPGDAAAAALAERARAFAREAPPEGWTGAHRRATK